MTEPLPQTPEEDRLHFTEDEIQQILDACENPPAPTPEMLAMMDDVLQWLK